MSRMTKAPLASILTVALSLLVLSPGLWAQGESPEPRTLFEALEAADLIAYGRVTGPPAEIWETGALLAVQELELLDVLKGDEARPRVNVLEHRRAAVGGFALLQEFPYLAAGDEYVLFLRRQDDAYEMVGNDNELVDHRLRMTSGESVADRLFELRGLLGDAAREAKAPQETGWIEEPAFEVLPPDFKLRQPTRAADDEKPETHLEALPGKATTQILHETFEGAFPAGAWFAYDDDGTTNGEVFWDDTSHRPYAGSWSAWCADGGPDASGPGGNYANNMNAWMVYGPFSLSDAVGGSFSFRYWNVSELGWDYFKYLVSIDGTSFYGTQDSGNSGGWLTRSVDLTSVPTLGDVTGDSSVWVAFHFTSDSSVTYEGAYVDEVYVQKTTATPADLDLQLIDAPSGTFEPGDPIGIQNVTQNVGGETSTPYRITFYASTNTLITSSDYELGFFDRGALAAGATHNRSSGVHLPLTLPDGNYYIGAILTVVDARASNNRNYDATPITVYGTLPADLDLQLVNAPSGTFEPGDPITIQNVVQNGGGETSTSYRITFYASTNTTITASDYSLGYADRPGLATLATHSYSTTLTLPLSLPSDSYYVGAILTVSDAASSNNVNYDSTPITVGTETELIPGVPVQGTITASVSQAEWDHYYIDLPAGTTSLVVDLYNLPSTAPQDLELYVRHATKPTTAAFDCASRLERNSAEQCTFSSPAAGRWWVGVNNWETGSISYTVRALGPVTEFVFGDGFESGDLSAWSSSTP